MKNGLSFGLAFGLLASIFSCSDENKKPEYDIWGLNCSVKEVKVTTYEAKSKFGEVVKCGIAQEDNYIAVFNAKGDIQSVSVFNKDGDLEGMQKYKYDSNGNLTELSSYDNDGELFSQLLSEYESKHEVRSIYKILWSDNVDIYEYTNEWNGESIVSQTTTRNGELHSVTKYTRQDKNGNEWIQYDKDGVEMERGHTLMNEAGRIIRHSNGDYCCEVEYNEKGVPVHIKNAYLYLNTQPAMNSSCKNIYYIEYEYDQRGNWIKQIVYEGEMKKPVRISEREIFY